MAAQIINALQGSPEWHQHRATHHNASDAPAMLGISPYKSRSDLLKEKATGAAEVVDAATQRRFDKGHEYEAIARPWAEGIIGEDLYPVVLSHEIEGLPLSASLDGLTMADEIAFEHKTLNQELATSLDEGVIPEHHRAQMEQQLLVSGAERCLFMASKGDRETMRHAWYKSDPEMRARLIAGWKQFERDLDAYEPPAPTVEAVGRAPETLPALRIEVQGMVTASNLAEFKEHALSVFGGIKTDLQTDEDFANADKTVKWCGDVEQRLDAAKEHALSQTASISELFRTIDDIKAEARAKRLELNKLVTARKEAIREEIRQAAVNALRDHYNSINVAFAGRVVLGVPAAAGADVAAAMKGKRTIASLQDAADTALAAAKIEADQLADRVRQNLSIIDQRSDYAHLLPDAAQLAVSKAADDLTAIIAARISEHEAAEAKRLEAERERIRREEQRKLEEEQRAKEQAEAAAAQRQRHEAEEAARRAAGKCDGNHGGPACGDPECWKTEPADPSEPPTLRLGQINERLAPLTLTPAALAELGVKPVATDRAAPLYHESDFARICDALVRRVQDAKATNSPDSEAA